MEKKDEKKNENKKKTENDKSKKNQVQLPQFIEKSTQTPTDYFNTQESEANIGEIQTTKESDKPASKTPKSKPKSEAEQNVSFSLNKNFI